MKRAAVMPAALALAALVLLAACGRPTVPADRSAPPPDQPRPTQPRRTQPARPAAVTEAEVDLGLRLYQREAAKQAGSNVMLSPHGVHAVLAMLLAGSKGTTESELRALLRAADSTQRIKDVYGLEDALRSPNVELGNSTWTDARFHLAPEYQKLVPDARSVDFAKAAEKARVAINASVKEATHGRIPELLKQAPASETVLILVSTAYLKAKWTTPFDAFETAPRPFTTGKGTPVQAPTMKQLGQYALGKGDGWQAVALPYQGDRLRMVAVVPDDLGAFESKLGPALLEQVRASLRAAPRSIELTMPKFTFRTDAQLNATLQALGAKTMFDERAADLSGITGPGGPPLVVSAVLQQTWLQVDEEGTEAAAATAGIVRATAAHIAPESFHVDRPFLFFVEDQPTGAVLFLGRVVDPTAP